MPGRSVGVSSKNKQMLFGRSVGVFPKNKQISCGRVYAY